jgi:hypothetical protein
MGLSGITLVDMKALAILVMLAGCGVYSDGGDDVGPDAAVVAEHDAVECEPTLPTCSSLGCAVGALPLDCPREDDTSVCYCAVPAKNPGWCRNE